MVVVFPPMRANPGGNIAGDQVVGRQGLIADLWSRLVSQSVVLTAERRMGKTSIVRKMAADRHRGQIYFRDLEQVHSAYEFADLVWRDAEPALRGATRARLRVARFLEQAAGASVGSLKLPESMRQHWKRYLLETVADLVEHSQGPIFLFWDELPLMLENVLKQDANVAMELLDALRSIRQTHASVRMLFTGSVGLHHVLGQLRMQGHANRPINDMFPMTVEPLGHDDATALALALMQGEQLEGTLKNESANMLAHEVDGMPFYIHHVVAAASLGARRISPAIVADLVNRGIHDPAGGWDLRSYRERLDRYLQGEDLAAALEILDAAAVVHPAGVSVGELADAAALRVPNVDRERVTGWVHSLARDHYLRAADAGRFAFVSSVVARWWKSSRGL